MFEFVLAMAMKFWQWTVLIAVVIIAAIINKFDKKAKTKLKFSYKELPHLQPLRIPTKDKGFWGAIIMWLLSSGIRCADSMNTLNAADRSRITDGASIPTSSVAARIMNQLLTSREGAIWPFRRASSTRFCVGSSVFCDLSVVSSANAPTLP